MYCSEILNKFLCNLGKAKNFYLAQYFSVVVVVVAVMVVVCLCVFVCACVCVCVRVCAYLTEKYMKFFYIRSKILMKDTAKHLKARHYKMTSIYLLSLC